MIIGKWDSIWKGFKLPVPVEEYQFTQERKWRFDFYFIDFKVAVEIEGGAWKNGRHNRAKGFFGDMEKYNAAAENGIIILRYPSIKKIDFEQVRQTLYARDAAILALTNERVII
jgi:ACR3 family arsenite efflux pump ArsB